MSREVDSNDVVPTVYEFGNDFLPVAGASSDSVHEEVGRAGTSPFVVGNCSVVEFGMTDRLPAHIGRVEVRGVLAGARAGLVLSSIATGCRRRCQIRSHENSGYGTVGLLGSGT